MRHFMKCRMIFIIMLCAVFLFAGCGQGETTDEVSFNIQEEDAGGSGQESEAAASLISCEFTDVYLRITEPYGSSYILNGNVSQTEVEGHTYQFTSDIAQEDCLSFVQAQETLSAFLEEKGISTERMTYRVLSDYTNWTDSEEALAYFGLNTMESWEQVLTTLQVSLGDYTNYGYLYALANYVAEELGWETDMGVLTEDVASAGATAATETTGADGSEENITTDLFREDPYLLNLVYPCFDEVYTEKESIQVCKALALQIFDRLTDPYAGEEAFADEIEAWAQEQGIGFTPTYLQFAYYSESCPLKMTTQYLEVYRTESYIADNNYKDGYITEDYFSRAGTIIPVFEWLDEQLITVCEMFDLYPADKIEVRLMDTVARISGTGNPYGGRTYFESLYICATTIVSLTHEYAHCLYYLSGGGTDTDDDYGGWCNEAAAYNFGGTLWMYYESIFLDSDYMTEVEALLGETFDEPEDFIRWARINAREKEDPQYLTVLKSGTGGGYKIAFGEYFMRTYGEEAFFNSMLHPSQAEEYTGKTMDEILEDWCVDMADPEMDALVSYPDWFSY